MSDCNGKTSQIFDKISELRETFQSGYTRDLAWRMRELKQMEKMYMENQDLIFEALYKDFRKNKHESILYEYTFMLSDVQSHIRNLEFWSRDEIISRNVLSIADRCYIVKEPYGVALVMSSWNYPLHLAFIPLCGAIAAGNCAVVKPSEIAPACAKLLQKLVEQYLDPRAIAVFQGDGAETENLLKFAKFDYIFFTGSQRVGRILHSYANKHLTPLTLELSGKSPCYIDETADLKKTAERIMWGKCLNLGMACIAPDYVLCNKNIEKKFVLECYKVLENWFNNCSKTNTLSEQELEENYQNGGTLKGNPNWKDSNDLSRIINENQFDRLVNYIKEIKENLKNGFLPPKIALGGNYDRENLWIDPTIITDITIESAIMQEEIFGPILAILNVDSHDDAIKLINNNDQLRNPLTIYVFSDDREVQLQFQNRTQSGTLNFNDTILSYALSDIPFGGIGSSGMGSYHGKASFDTFTHQKGVAQKDFSKMGDLIGYFRYPPYKDWRVNWLSGLFLMYQKFKIPNSERNFVGEKNSIISKILLFNPITLLFMWLVCDVLKIAGHPDDQRQGRGFKNDYIVIIVLKILELYLFKKIWNWYFYT